MKFNRYGKSFQMVIENGNDLEDALKLDEALWGAISAPNAAFACDPRLLELMDSDKKGRITSTDVKDAIRWLLEQLPDHSAIKPDFDGKLPLDSINATSDTGKALVESAKYILGELKASDTASITLAQIREFIATVNARSLNGDGVITPKAAADKAVTDSAAVADLVNDAVSATGGVKDIDGSMGMDMKTMDAFLAEVPKYLDWLDKGAIPAGQQKTDLMPFGADTGALAALVKANAPKVSQFFELCRLTQFDSRIQAKALATDAKVAAFDPANTADVTAYQKDMPLSVPQPDGVLPFEHEKINPAYISEFSALVAKVAKPILGEGQDGMTQADWDRITATFAPYEAYMAAKAGASVEKIPVGRLRTYLETEALITEVKRLMVADAKVADTVKAAREVERLLLYRGNLLRLANNFICFSELYSPTAHALFECGKVVIDGRWFSVAFKVDSPAAH
ncbi:MAG: hypothetical protein IJJ33_10500 [Victivallales bacterium]|nr:hypothetical protein [Victivallales bacterium]